MRASRHGESPLFFHASPRALLVDDAPHTIRARLEAYGETVAPDTTGILEGLLLDIPLRHRTLYKGISKILPGEEITLGFAGGMVRRRVTWVPAFDNPSLAAQSEEQLVDRAKDVLNGLLAPHLSGLVERKVLIPLSGGLDSRLLFCLLKKNKIASAPVVFGPPKSNDVRVARSVAEQMGADILYLPLEDEDYYRFGRQVSAKSGGMTTPMHCHLYATLSKLDMPYDVLVHGYLGGEYAGECQRVTPGQKGLTRSEALRVCVDHIPGRNPLWQRLRPEQKDAIYQDLDEAMDDCLAQNAPCRLEEFLRCIDREALIANTCSLNEEFGKIVYPFANDEYADFFCGLPPEMRKGRRLFRRACLELFPDAFALPDQSETRIDGTVSRLHRLYKRLCIAAYYASFRLSAGRATLNVPYVFERHLNVLSRQYAEEMEESARFVGDLLQMDLRDFGRFSFTQPARIPTRFWMITAKGIFSREGNA